GITLADGNNGNIFIAEGGSVSATGAGSIGIAALDGVASSSIETHNVTVHGTVSSSDGPAIFFGGSDATSGRIGDVEVSGTISGGNGVAVDFPAGNFGSTFRIAPGAVVQGTVDAKDGNDSFNFTGSSGEAGTFDLGLFDTQFLNFDGLIKEGSSASSWALSGSSAFAGPLRIIAGDIFLDNVTAGGINAEVNASGTSTALFSGSGTIGTLEVDQGTLSPGGGSS
ncbi:MAG: hypothetical protein KDE25_15125, partial [Novosphingobium sp.]|nr:hypothetical protein [Novosphingobium sp.]